MDKQFFAFLSSFIRLFQAMGFEIGYMILCNPSEIKVTLDINKKNFSLNIWLIDDQKDGRYYLVTMGDDSDETCSAHPGIQFYRIEEDLSAFCQKTFDALMCMAGLYGLEFKKETLVETVTNTINDYPKKVTLTSRMARRRYNYKEVNVFVKAFMGAPLSDKLEDDITQAILGVLTRDFTIDNFMIHYGGWRNYTVFEKCVKAGVKHFSK